MNFKVTALQAQHLKPGDLFSTAGEDYWKARRDKKALGERVYIRTEAPCPAEIDLRAFHGDPAVKAKYLKRVRAHRAADRLIHGSYWEGGKGCAVGCTVETANQPHVRYEVELGIPRILARLEDCLFEGMGNGGASRWPTDFLSAIPVGADLSLVWPQFAVWLLVDKRSGVIKYAKNEKQREAIQRVADLCAQVLGGETVADSDWRAAAAAAYATTYAYAAAAAAAAYATTDAYAAAAADAAAAAATYATTYAADAAAAADAARTSAYARMAKKLLALLKAAPVPKKAKVA